MIMRLKGTSMMRSTRRGLLSGRLFLLCVTIAVLVGSAVVLYRVYENNKPLTAIAERADQPLYSTSANIAAETVPAMSLNAVLAARRSELERDPNAPVLGNPEGDVTVVEFFDYNCPFCKKVADDLKTLISGPGAGKGAEERRGQQPADVAIRDHASGASPFRDLPALPLGGRDTHHGGGGVCQRRGFGTGAAVEPEFFPLYRCSPDHHLVPDSGDCRRLDGRLAAPPGPV